MVPNPPLIKVKLAPNGHIPPIPILKIRRLQRIIAVTLTQKMVHGAILWTRKQDGITVSALLKARLVVLMVRNIVIHRN